jgi:hypothetical protein
MQFVFSPCAKRNDLTNLWAGEGATRQADFTPGYRVSSSILMLAIVLCAVAIENKKQKTRLGRPNRGGFLLNQFGSWPDESDRSLRHLRTVSTDKLTGVTTGATKNP